MNISSETFHYFQRTGKRSPLRKRFLVFTKQYTAWVFLSSNLQCPWKHLETMPGSQVGLWCALLVWKRPNVHALGTFSNGCHRGIKWPVSTSRWQKQFVGKGSHLRLVLPLLVQGQQDSEPRGRAGFGNSRAKRKMVVLCCLCSQCHPPPTVPPAAGWEKD